MVKRAFDAQRELIVLASKSQKPSTVSSTTTLINVSFFKFKLKVKIAELLYQSKNL